MDLILFLIVIFAVWDWQKLKEFDAKWQNGQVSDTGKVIFCIVVFGILAIIFILPHIK